MDGVDRWDSDSDLVWNTAGNAHSWIVLYKSDYPSTGKSIDILISLAIATASPHLFNYACASMAFSGGSTTADPTTTTGTKTRTLTNRQLSPSGSVVTNCRYHIMRNTDGDVYLLVSQNSTGRCQHFTCSAKTLGQRTGTYADPFPFFAHSSYATGAGGAPTAAQTINPTNCIGFNAHDDLGNSNTVIAGIYGTSGTNVQSSIPSTGDAHSSQYPMIPAIIWSGSPAYQIRGYLADVKIGPSGSGVAQGTEEPASPAASTTVLLGELWIPNGGTTIVM
jgi:hypothetical protein